MFAWCCSSACADPASRGMDYPTADLDQANTLDESLEDMRSGTEKDRKGLTTVLKGEAAEKTAPAAVVPEREPGPGAEFVIEIRRKPDEPVGMDLDPLDGVTLLVVAAKAGAIQVWNTQHPALAVKAGDKIHEVNGVRNGTSQIISTLKESTDWKIVLQRPRELVLNLDKKQNTGYTAPSMGLTLSYAKNGGTVLITEVSEGPVMDWNFENVEFQVQALDRIVEVNGSKGQAQELLQRSEESDQICMKVWHYPKLARYDTDSESEADGGGAAK